MKTKKQKQRYLKIGNGFFDIEKIDLTIEKIKSYNDKDFNRIIEIFQTIKEEYES
jgi:hypothetical protein